jgi:hypothetical protein
VRLRNNDVDYGKYNEAEIMRGLRNIFRGIVAVEYAGVYGQVNFHVKPSAKTNCETLNSEDLYIPNKIVHCGIFAPTGAGKTYMIAFLMWLYCIADRDNNTRIVLMDQKMSFAERLGVSDSPSFYYGSAVFDGLEAVVEEFEQVKLNPDGIKRVVFIDEFASFIDRSGKQANHARSLVSKLVLESREYGYSVILAGQSGHAERFGPGVRDSLTSLITLGNLSSTEKRMLFPDDIALMDAHNDVGEGYMRIHQAHNHVIRFSVKDSVPDFSKIGSMVIKRMS